jgi:hypothetical protein
MKLLLVPIYTPGLIWACRVLCLAQGHRDTENQLNLGLPGFLKSKSGVVVHGQPGSQILLAHQKYWLPITNRSYMNSSSKSFGVYFVVSCSKVSRCPVDNWRVAGTCPQLWDICPRRLDNQSQKPCLLHRSSGLCHCSPYNLSMA